MGLIEVLFLLGVVSTPVVAAAAWYRRPGWLAAVLVAVATTASVAWGLSLASGSVTLDCHPDCTTGEELATGIFFLGLFVLPAVFVVSVVALVATWLWPRRGTAGKGGSEGSGDDPVGPGSSADDAPREANFLLAGPERRALRWIAARLPRWVMPDHLTALGVLAAIGIAAAYVLSNEHAAWLWAVNALLVVHWLGDSLDGTLARVRGIERPRYGYYLDHLVDALSTILIGVGLGLSPHMLLATGLVIVVAYLFLSINVYLETYAFRRFRLGYGRLGPTEARLALIALNTALAVGVGLHVDIGGLGVSALDAIGLGLAGAMLTALGVRAVRNLRELAIEEPSARPA